MLLINSWVEAYSNSLHKFTKLQPLLMNRDEGSYRLCPRQFARRQLRVTFWYNREKVDKSWRVCQGIRDVEEFTPKWGAFCPCFWPRNSMASWQGGRAGRQLPPTR